MKKVNGKVALGIALRLSLAFLLGTAISFIFIYVLFKDTVLVELLLDNEIPGEFVLSLLVMWFFGAVSGSFVVATAFVNALSAKDNKIQQVTQENDYLRKKLSKSNKKYAPSTANRIFGEIGSDKRFDSTRKSTSSDLDDFSTLQEELKAQFSNSQK